MSAVRPSKRTAKRRSAPAPARARGQIIEKGEGKYLCRAFVGRDRRTGKREYTSVTVEGSRSKAQKALDRLLGEIASGAYRQPVKVTLASYLTEQWLVERETDVRAGLLNARSLADYRRAVTKLVAIAGALQLDRINRAEVAYIRTQLLAHHGEQLVAAQRAFDVFRMALKRAWQLDLIPVNYAPAERRIKAPPARTGMLDAAQMSAFLKAAEGYRYGRLAPLFRLLLQAGLRPGEALALRWDDLQGRTLHVGSAVTLDAEGNRVVGTTKTKVARTIPLLPETVESLNAYKAAQLQTIMRSGARLTWDRSGRLMFPNEDGGLMRIERVRTAWNAILKKAGLPKVRLYDARHSFCTALLHNGIDPVTAAQLAGHKDPAMTLRRYAHATPASKADAIDRLGAALSRAAVACERIA